MNKLNTHISVKKRITVIVLTAMAMLIASCAQFEVDTSRTNPFDIVHDSGDLRLVLNKPRLNDSGSVLIEWSDVFHKTESLSEDNFNLVSTSLFAYTGIPGETAVNNIKNRQTDGLGAPTIATISRNSDKTFKNFHTLGSFPGAVTTYFISGNYVLTKENGNTESGIFYSNLVVYDPAGQ